MPRTKTLEEYLSTKIITDEGCWTLPANLNGAGYTKVSIGNKASLLHRLIMEPVPRDMDVDHMCHNNAAKNRTCTGGITCRHRRCFNPEHLRIVTRRENLDAGNSNYWNRDACPSGHPRSEENTYTTKHGSHICWECHKAHARKAKRAWRLRQKELINGG